MNKHPIIFNKFMLKTRLDCLSFYKELLTKKYSTESNFGFSDINIIDNIVSATLLKNDTAYYRTWNVESNNIERKLYPIIKEIRFYLNFTKGFFVVEGSISDMNLVKQVFRSLFWNKFVYINLSITPFDYIKIFHKDGILNNIEELVIDDFRYQKKFIGRYVTKFMEPILKLESLYEYKSNITKIKANLLYKDFKIKFVSCKNSTLSIYCEEDIKISFFEYITNKIY